MAFTKTPMSPEERLEANRAKARRDYEKHKEKRRAVQNAWNAANPGRKAALHQKYRDADPERYKEYGRQEAALRRVKRPWLASFHSRRKKAEKVGLEFTLTMEWAKRTYTGFCALTGLPFDVSKAEAGKMGPRPMSISIDRIDQTKGYTPDNCRFILSGVNSFRGSGTDANAILMARALLNNQTQGVSYVDPPGRSGLATEMVSSVQGQKEYLDAADCLEETSSVR